jgi:hypothetical protein
MLDMLQTLLKFHKKWMNHAPNVMRMMDLSRKCVVVWRKFEFEMREILEGK